MHRSARLLIPLVALAVAACATQLPPPVRVADVRALVGSYSGSMKEYGTTPRPATVVIKPDNSFEVTTGGPEGFRTSGVIAHTADGDLVWQTGQVKGRAAVYEGDGRRVIVFQREDGSSTTTVERRLP
jgi:hypothetical protein